MAARTGRKGMYKLDGHHDVIQLEDLQPGNIIRMGSMFPNSAGGEWVSSAFSDNVILKVAKADEHGDVWVTLGRPFGYAHLTCTTSPSLLLSHEEYTVTAARLVGGTSLYRLVLMSTGEPATMHIILACHT
jgi:hypothetical protein